ncbi:MAG: response regulator transcription factor [Acidimicrobiia bacterium]
MTDPLARLLVVDDEESLVEMLAAALRFGGYEVETAMAGYDALRAVRRAEPDLIVLDVNLPDVDGFEVCRRLRRDGVAVPVVFLTARDDADDLRTGFRRGGDDYLTKPFSLEELGLRIEAILRRTGTAAEAANRLVCGDVTLDDDAHRVWVGDDEVSLSPTEFRLLRYLMANRDRVLSKGQILDQVWEYDFDGNANVVETYVSYLRTKLAAAESGRIHTVRGVGYVLRTDGS